MFGGSTMFCNEVPDWLTIPSLVQARVRDRWGGRFAVVNHGIPGFTVTDQLALLRATDLHRGDIVVFYDGTNEVYHWIFYGYADPEIAKRSGLGREMWSWRERLTFAIWERLHRYSVFVRRFCNVTRMRRWSVPAHLKDDDLRDRLLERSKKELARALLEADALTRNQGATFLHFLQPTLFTQTYPSEYERWLAANHNIVFAGLEVAHREGYRGLRATLAELPIQTFDLGDALDARRPGAEFFLDDCHVTHDANRLVADRIFEALARKLADAS